MSLKDLEIQLHRAEERGTLVGSVASNRALYVARAGQKEFLRGYYQEDKLGTFAKAEDDVRAMDKDQKLRTFREGKQYLKDALTRDQIAGYEQSFKLEGNIHTTSDYPAVLALIRSREVRQAFQGVYETPLMALARKRTATDFKTMKGVRGEGSQTELDESGEKETVRTLAFGETEDGYNVVKFQNAVAWTYELQKNGDIDTFKERLRMLGDMARRTRSLRLLRAVKLGATRVTLPIAGVGGPTAARIDELLTIFGQQSVNGVEQGRDLKFLHIPTRWKQLAAQALLPSLAATPNENYLNALGVTYGSSVIPDALLSRVTGGLVTAADWLAYGNSEQPFCEFSVLDDFVAGPQLMTRVSDASNGAFGSFEDCSLEIKIMDGHGAQLIDATNVILVAGV